MKPMRLLFLLLPAVLICSCTKLDEELRSTLDNASSSVNAAGLLQSAYESLNTYQNEARIWALSEHSSDEAIAPTRGPDWDDNGDWRHIHAHTWGPDHAYIRETFRELLQAQFAASSVLDKSPSPQEAAEARFIRALSVFAVLDLYDQVPFRSDLVDLRKLPETLQGVAAADFIISELNDIMASLPDGPAIKASKDAARALLMKTYLNKGAFANRASPTFDPGDMAQVVSLADQITASSRNYSLADNFYDNFAPDNYSNAC